MANDFWNKYKVSDYQLNGSSGTSNQGMSSQTNSGDFWSKYKLSGSNDLSSEPVVSSNTSTHVVINDEWANAPEGIRTARQRDLERQNSLPENASTFDRFKSYIGAPVTEQQYADRNARALGAADAATLGFADEIYGGAKALPQALFGSPESFARTYAENRDVVRDATRNARENNSSNYTSGSIAGALGTAALPLGAVARGTGLARQVGTGAKIGALAGFGGSERDDTKGFIDNLIGLSSDTLSGAGVGAVGGALGAGAGRAISGAANVIKRRGKDAGRVVTGTIDFVKRGLGNDIKSRNSLYTDEGIKEATNALRQEANNLYKQSEQRSVIFKPDFTKNLSNEIKDNLAEFGYSDTLHSKVNGILTEVERLQGKNVTLKGIDNLRKQVNSVLSAKSAEPAEKAIAANINNIIDSRLGNASTDEILAGNVENARDAVGLITQARDNWRKQAKLNEVSGLLDKAERRAAVSGTGGNEQNTVRQNINRILDNPRGWSDSERDIMRQIVKGSNTQNALRLGSAFAPTTGKLNAAGYGAGFAATGFNPLVLVAAAAGEAAKRGANKIVDRNANDLLRTILNNGQTLYERQPAFSSPIEQLIRDYLSGVSSIQSRELVR